MSSLSKKAMYLPVAFFMPIFLGYIGEPDGFSVLKYFMRLSLDENS